MQTLTMAVRANTYAGPRSCNSGQQKHSDTIKRKREHRRRSRLGEEEDFHVEHTELRPEFGEPQERRLNTKTATEVRARATEMVRFRRTEN